MKIAVTTASGNLGSTVIEHLKGKIGSENVIGIARTPSKAEWLGVEIRKGDYNNKEDFLEALKGVDALLLVSGMDAPEKRIGQHRNVIEAAKECGVKKIVYTSIIGATEGNAFSPIVESNRETEQDIKDSGMLWAIGRNGIYIEPDLEYVETYKKEGGIVNSAGDGRCCYTSRTELAYAYFKLLTEDSLVGYIYNLLGTPLSQQQLAAALNRNYKINLYYKALTVEQYTAERQTALGEFLGTVIGGIYEGIYSGKFDVSSDYERVTGRAHKTIDEMIKEYMKSPN